MRVYRITAEDEEGMIYNHQLSYSDSVPASLYPYSSPAWFWQYLIRTMVEDLLKIMGDETRAEWVGSVEYHDLESV